MRYFFANYWGAVAVVAVVILSFVAINYDFEHRTHRNVCGQVSTHTPDGRPALVKECWLEPIDKDAGQ